MAEESDPSSDVQEEHTQTVVVDHRRVFRWTSCRVSVTAGPNAGLVLDSDRARIRIGKGASNDLVLEDRTVSREHAEIVATDKGYLLIDLGSTNGTFVEGRRVERAFLAPRTQIQLGESTRLTFTPLEEELASDAEAADSFAGMVGSSPRMRQVFGLLKRVAPMDVSVLIQGETGTGKELAARALHDQSRRRDGPFVVIDCSAIPENLIESELFGHEKGAFTGAVSSRAGAFERARGGTVFLDEMGELRIDLQPKLLRVLETRELRRVGGNEVIPVDVRVIAATNRDLVEEIRNGHFREDLYFRLAVILVQLPSLRERREDIPLIVRSALSDPEVVQSHRAKSFSPDAMARMVDYAWPGNIRELVNVVSHVLAFSEGDEIDAAALPTRFHEGGVVSTAVAFNEHLSFKKAKEQLLEAFEREYLSTLIKRCSGNLSQAARSSGMHRKSIERLVKKYELDVKGLRAR